MPDFGNVDAFASILALTAAPVGTLTADQINRWGRGLKLGINVTAVTSSPSMVVTIRGKDVASGQYYTLLASAAITGAGFTLMTVYPGIAASANVAADDILPGTWNIEAVITGSGTVTGTIGASVIL